MDKDTIVGAAAVGVTEVLVTEEEVPIALTADTVNVYPVPNVYGPVINRGLDVPEVITRPATAGLEVTVYPVIAEPPVAPAVNGIDTDVSLGDVGVPRVGAAGEVVIKVLEVVKVVEFPIAFVAFAVKT